MKLVNYVWHDTRFAASALSVAVHTTLAATLLAIGVELMMPPSTFDTGHLWDLFRPLGDETMWGARYIVAALLGFAGLLCRARWCKLLSVTFLSSAHGATALMFMIAVPQSTYSLVMLCIAALGYTLLGLIVREIA